VFVFQSRASSLVAEHLRYFLVEFHAVRDLLPETGCLVLLQKPEAVFRSRGLEHVLDEGLEAGHALPWFLFVGAARCAFVRRRLLPDLVGVV